MAEHLVAARRLSARLREAARTERVPVAGGQVTWRRFGMGAPLVLLHGGHGSWLHWARNIEPLAQRYTVWAPDLPGYGDSDLPSGASLDDLVAATSQSLDKIVGKEASVRLAGFSFGGLVAARLAERRGGVSHLALFGPAGHGGPRRPRGELRAWRGLETGGEGWNAVMRHNLLMHMLHAPAAVDADALEIHGQACLRTRFHSKPISRAGGLAQSLQGLGEQFLLAWGEHDVTLDPGLAAEALGKFRSCCCVHTIEGAGHWVQYEAADAVNSLLLHWLDQPIPEHQHD